jgi:hypothetical protein
MHTHNLYPPSSPLQGSHLNIHLLQVRRNLKLRLSLTPHLLNANPLSNLLQRQPLDPIAIENRQIRNNRRHALLPRERKRALLEDLGVALLVHVLHGDDDLGLRRVGDEIHGAADALDLARQHEVGEVAELVDLHGAQHGDVDAAGADHAEGFVGAEGRGAADEGDGFFARVDQVGVPDECVSRVLRGVSLGAVLENVLFAGLGVPAHSQNAVLGLEHDFSAFGEEGGCCEGHADAEVDVHAVFEFLGCALDDAFALLRGL